jgi:lysophospholipase L1-like esterase
MHKLLPALVAAAALALAPAAVAAPSTYVSIGDSYAAGYQATGQGTGTYTTEGFAHQLPALAKAKGYDLKLVNFSCGGATTVSVLRTKGCRERARAIGWAGKPGLTQLQAAERYLRRNRGKVALVTVSIGGNDFTKCAAAPNAVTCVAGIRKVLLQNVGTIAKRLRAAGGKDVQLVGITYPDVILGDYLSGVESKVNLAKLSVVAFKAIINPALKQAYTKAGGTFVDVTAATGAYTPLEQTVAHPQYGTIPVAVAKVCELTWYCEFGDIHARTNGYGVIAELIAAKLKRRS